MWTIWKQRYFVINLSNLYFFTFRNDGLYTIGLAVKVFVFDLHMSVENMDHQENNSL